MSSELHEGTQKRTSTPKSSRGRPQQTKCCLGDNDATQQGKDRGLPRSLPLETSAGGMSYVLHDRQRSSHRITPFSSRSGAQKEAAETFCCEESDDSDRTAKCFGGLFLLERQRLALCNGQKNQFVISSVDA